MSDSRWAGLLFAATLLCRVVAGLGSAVFGTDSAHFLLMADWMREGRWGDALAIAYHPMYPLLVATARSVVLDTETAGQAVSILLGSAAALPLFWLVREIFGLRPAVFTVLFYAFSSAFVLIHSDPMTEGTFHFFLFSSHWMTWRVITAPSMARSAVLGAAAAGAFLTRPEGLLAVALAAGWPVIALIRKRDAAAMRIAGLVLTVLVAATLLAPYLLWVKSHRGRWALSPRQSVVSVELEMGVSDSDRSGEKVRPPSYWYGVFFQGVLRLTLYGAWIPFFVAGLITLRRPGSPGRWFVFSLPLAYLAAILYTLRSHPFMTDRYLMAPMALLAVLGGLGMDATLQAMARRWPDARWRPAAAGALVLAFTLVPFAKCLLPRRTECRSYPVAAQRILQDGPRPRAMSGPVEQVAYLCGARSLYSAGTHEGVRKQIEESGVDCYVYSERDVAGRREYIQMLRTCPSLQPPVEVVGPPGTLKVYYQRAKVSRS
jgi:4-amino-4-deoxy-L-arabinose transferase-like glycosyltransferase